MPGQPCPDTADEPFWQTKRPQTRQLVLAHRTAMMTWRTMIVGDEEGVLPRAPARG